MVAATTKISIGGGMPFPGGPDDMSTARALSEEEEQGVWEQGPSSHLSLPLRPSSFSGLSIVNVDEHRAILGLVFALLREILSLSVRTH